jgi:NADPH-dependent curcumin reductase CurA
VHTATDSSETIDVANVPLDGGFLVKTLVLSVDPYLRGKMKDASKQTYTVFNEELYS